MNDHAANSAYESSCDGLSENPTSADADGSSVSIEGTSSANGENAATASVPSLRASVVINTFNREKYLRNAIRSIGFQTYPQVELIVVNGPSTDGTEALLDDLERNGTKLKRVRCKNRNLSESRNIGISYASGDVVFFIDDDAVAHPDWIARLMLAYEDPTVAGAGGFTVDHTGVSFQCRYTVCDRFGNATLFNTIDPTPILEGIRGFRFPSLLGTNCSFRREELLKIDGFDEVYAYFLDETDVCLRLVERNLRIITVPKALVFHKYAPSDHRTVERVPGSLRAPARSKAHFTLKHCAHQIGSSADRHAELDRYVRELQFSNRWFLDHKKISVEHYLRLDRELQEGLAEGTRVAMTGTHGNSETAATRAVRDAMSPFVSLVAESRSRAIRERLRIYFVSQGYPPQDTSGIARWTHECARSLNERGHEVHVVTRSADDATFVDYVDGIWVHSVADKLPQDLMLPSPVDIPESLARRAAAVLDELKRSEAIWGVDVVSAPIWDLEGIFCVRHFNRPVVTSLHTTYLLALPSKPDWLERPAYRRDHVDKVIRGERWLLRNSASILGNSEEIVREIDRAYGVTLSSERERLHVVPHGISDAEPVLASTSSESTRDEVALLFVGRIEARKGVDQLLRALLRIRCPNCRIVLRIVGAWSSKSDSYAKTVQALAQEVANKRRDISVEFIGYAPDEVLRSYYDSADIFVAPSRFESFGLIIIEAMRSGLPVIAADVGGMREIVDEQTGFLFRSEDHEGLASRLEMLIEDGALRSRMGRAGREKFRRAYTSETMASRLEAYFRNVINSGVER